MTWEPRQCDDQQPALFSPSEFPCRVACDRHFFTKHVAPKHFFTDHTRTRRHIKVFMKMSGWPSTLQRQHGSMARVAVEFRRRMVWHDLVL